MAAVFFALLILAVGLAAAVVHSRRKARRSSSRSARHGNGWAPSVQHRELPPPVEDPLVDFAQPRIEEFAAQLPPLSRLPLSPSLRGQLDGHALGRAKRILEAPDLLTHAAADAESWPQVEAAVNRALALLSEHQGGLLSEGAGRLTQALALCAAQGVLLAEWRQLEDGTTSWRGEAAQVRASDVFTIERIAESMKRRLLPDLYAGISKRPTGLDIAQLVPLTLASAFYLRLRGEPPKAFAA